MFNSELKFIMNNKTTKKKKKTDMYTFTVY